MITPPATLIVAARSLIRGRFGGAGLPVCRNGEPGAKPGVEA